MKFKDEKSETEFQRVHPATRAAAVLFDDWSRSGGFPEALITDVMDEEHDGVDRNASSWHRASRLTAVDFRTHHYTKEQLLAVGRWFELRFSRPMWELITKDHGTAPHIHLARRDYAYAPPKG